MPYINRPINALYVLAVEAQITEVDVQAIGLAHARLHKLFDEAFAARP